MNKCKKCGTEFEGNCCPNCGTWADGEKTCPKCGAKLKANANFCNNCGFSFGGATENKPQNSGAAFKEKCAKLGKWIKAHLKVVIPLAIAVLFVIILACSIPACVKRKDNGTYFKLKGEEIDKKTYFIIDSGKWKDEDGNSGTYKKDGDKIVFYIEFFGSIEEAGSGTIKNGVLIMDEGGAKQSYISENHKHNYGEWKKATEATSTSCATETRTCICGIVEKRTLHTPEGDWLVSEKEHYKLCKVCKQKCEIAEHSGETFCSVCNFLLKPTDGLEYTLNSDRKSYTVSGVGSAKNIQIIRIPSTYNNLPVTSIGINAFFGFSLPRSITIPDSVTYIGISAFEDCSSLTSVTIGSGVTSIGERAFYNCRSLTSITIPDGVTSIGSRAFYGCSSLTSVTIGSGVTSIGERAFYNCRSLTSITIPDSVTSIGEDAFRDCNSLASITIPDSVTIIGSYAFYGCSALRSITIPDSVTSIGDYAFRDCRKLTIHCETKSQPSGWSSNWNYSNCPVVWGDKGN